ncbi:hypothetical protein B0H14DRAFT_2583390 [Mycena olivaceomarginata]|nr:hypothetical protein B0H14DRAFT_2583390 [Mycena olivaceomarginata]
MSDLAVYRPLRVQAYEDMSNRIWREYMRYIEQIILAWSLREAGAQSRRELEVGRAYLRRRIALANEYRRAAQFLFVSYDISCQWRINVDRRRLHLEEHNGDVYYPVIHPHVFLASVSMLEHEETVVRTSHGASGGVVNGRDNGEKGDDLNLGDPAAVIKDGAWNGVLTSKEGSDVGGRFEAFHKARGVPRTRLGADRLENNSAELCIGHNVGDRRRQQCDDTMGNFSWSGGRKNKPCAGGRTQIRRGGGQIGEIAGGRMRARWGNVEARADTIEDGPDEQRKTARSTNTVNEILEEHCQNGSHTLDVWVKNGIVPAVTPKKQDERYTKASMGTVMSTELRRREMATKLKWAAATRGPDGTGFEQVGRLLQRAVVNGETAKTVGARAGLRIFARENEPVGLQPAGYQLWGPVKFRGKCYLLERREGADVGRLETVVHGEKRDRDGSKLGRNMLPRSNRWVGGAGAGVGRGLRREHGRSASPLSTLPRNGGWAGTGRKQGAAGAGRKQGAAGAGGRSRVWRGWRERRKMAEERRERRGIKVQGQRGRIGTQISGAAEEVAAFERGRGAGAGCSGVAGAPQNGGGAAREEAGYQGAGAKGEKRGPNIGRSGGSGGF